MLSYTFEDNNVPFYQQLYKFIKDDILNGKLYPNEPLPSKRAFARQLSISVITVENAYNQLLSEGFIYSYPRKGFYVYPVFSANPDISLDDFQKYIPQNIYTSHSTKSGILKSVNNNRTYNGYSVPKEYFADFVSNSTTSSSFPFSTWAKITRRVLSDEQDYLLKNSPSNGLPELRIAISDYLRSFRAINVSPDNIIICAGTESMFNILIQLLGRNKIYATEDPGYEKLALTLNANEVKNVKIPLDEYGVKVSEIKEQQVDIIHVTPSHHFPTGITMPIIRRQELLMWANEGSINNRNHSEKEIDSLNTGKSRYIIEDDYDSEFRHSGHPIPSLLSIDRNEKVIYMNTFTKSLASTIRISYMILPDHLMEKYNQILSFYSCAVSTFEQLTLARFMSEGHYEKHINRMRTASRKKRDLILNAIKKSPLSSISEIYEEQAGLHFILKLKMAKNQEQFLSSCEENGIKIQAVSENNFMINYSSIPVERIEEAIHRLSISAF